MAYHPNNDRIQELELALSEALAENERFRNQIAETSKVLMNMANSVRNIQKHFSKSSEEAKLVEIRLELMTEENRRLKEQLAQYRATPTIPTDALDQLGRE